MGMEMASKQTTKGPPPFSEVPAIVSKMYFHAATVRASASMAVGPQPIPYCPKTKGSGVLDTAADPFGTIEASVCELVYLFVDSHDVHTRRGFTSRT